MRGNIAVANWIVENRITGEVAYAYGADQPDHFGTFPLEQYNHIRQKEVEAVPVPRTITKLEYLRRFTTDERVAIRAAAVANPVLDDYMKLMELAQEINLDDPDTIAAVQMLEQSGLIATGRAAEVLA